MSHEGNFTTEKVRNYLKQFGRDNEVIELHESSATVELAAQALKTLPAIICKTLSFQTPSGPVLVMAAGDARIDNQKFRAQFNCKCNMLKSSDVFELTGYPPGGVCGFDNPEPCKKYCDVSLKRFSHVFPACGTASSAIKLTCDELFTLTKSIEWIDVCKAWDPNLKEPSE
ncbi:YbaK / prolyl-tRNA synthetases associated domain containing protein [Trichomonas vaginalis G3]|uniref:YbaK / prolyl-tRNA synthetases associated domain containing protein n=1 Tax=Trichomonas vaginalis (strain ATCC PRA-98 / G3) TaxID=412133 RepID=A2D925_TRIV3|nr:aminoacyl-tRNA editing domain-containing protein [Trichomonas vaginalis G3]EAY23051.1 YbaK / prolyl-tRNA synthetases associated domain containing protein [Trichomonas vaginalis G3]KAI5519020.1 aminoacyl-tRNA editing domain-containing protein [Trichomonas vaginalis G3]|eukprot:XP_001584037.1 YbaK / prolyl-tRNA synthetases associated domain containing protein [Trichomonas vaginalis G3]